MLRYRTEPSSHGTTLMEIPYQLAELPTDSPKAVQEAVRRELADFLGDAFPAPGFELVGDLFCGKIPPFRHADTPYHNLEHTLQVTLCFARIAARMIRAAEEPFSRQIVIHGLWAALLHDCGYLKRVNDPKEGTGARFTHIHERRSCHGAEIILRDRGWDSQHIRSVQRMIATTGSCSLVDAIPFDSAEERRMAQALGTADLLAQLGDPRYPEKLPLLFEEFLEAADAFGIPSDERPYTSLEDLLQTTPEFWKDTVLPRLEVDFEGLHSLLANPAPDSTNPYVEMVARNLARLRPARSAS